jgi:PEP-CTERM motif-containing protein
MTVGVHTHRMRTLLIRFRALPVAAAALVIGMVSTPVSADTIVLSTRATPFRPDSFNQGWWPQGANTNDNDYNPNYFTGSCCSGLGELRSFFTFNLEPIDFTTQRIAGASLQVNGAEYRGNEPVETLGLFDVSTPAAVLNRNTGTNEAIFADLGTGATYGTYQVAPYRFDAILTFGLNGVAISDMMSLDGSFFSIGARLLSSTEPGDYIFGASGAAASLVVQTEPLGVSPVPEPTSMLLLGTGFVGLVARRRIFGGQ